MLSSAAAARIRHIISSSSVFVGAGLWIYYSLSNIEALF
jgi:hypothetical protein